MGNPDSEAVPINNLSISLLIPFLDENDNTTKNQLVVADILSKDLNYDFVVTNIPLSNIWVNFCYGVLAYDNFQAQKASLLVSYSYRAYMPYQENQLTIAYGAKAAFTPIVYSPAVSSKILARSYFDASSGTYQYPNGEIHFKSEVISAKHLSHDKTPKLSVSDKINDSNISSVSSASIRPQLAGVATPIKVAKPSPYVIANLEELIAKTKYAETSFIHQESKEVFYPCDILGSLYIETLETGSRLIGCIDYLTLGKSTNYKQYKEIVELANSDYFTIFHSLIQPERFLLIPKRYCISRFAPDNEKPYKPIIIIYSSIGSSEENDKAIFQMTLQPDIPEFVMKDLKIKLAPYVPFDLHPVIEMPTEIVSEAQFTWAIEGSLGIESLVMRTSDSLQVRLVTGIKNALILKDMLGNTGILGTVVFVLPDKSALQSNLVMQLGAITGPLNMGPIQISFENGVISLSNRIERKIAITDVRVYEGLDSYKTNRNRNCIGSKFNL